MIGVLLEKRENAPDSWPDRLRVVGAQGCLWSCVPEPFGPTIAFSGAELAAAYGAPADAPEHPDEEAIRAPDPADLREAMLGYRAGAQRSDPLPPGETPESVFARASAAADGA